MRTPSLPHRYRSLFFQGCFVRHLTNPLPSILILYEVIKPAALLQINALSTQKVDPHFPATSTRETLPSRLALCSPGCGSSELHAGMCHSVSRDRDSFHTISVAFGRRGQATPSPHRPQVPAGSGGLLWTRRVGAAPSEVREGRTWAEAPSNGNHFTSQ